MVADFYDCIIFLPIYCNAFLQPGNVCTIMFTITIIITVIIIIITIIIIIIIIVVIIINTRPRPAFGRLGLGGSLRGYSSHG